MTTKTESNTSTAAGVTEESIQAFADRVRAALRDLPESDVVELTEGLEASLAEQAADSSPGSALPHEGDADAYAAELRDAAGLPASGGATGKPGGRQVSVLAVLDSRLQRMRANMLRRVRSNGAMSSLFDFFVALQPIWWVVRAVLACLIVASLLYVDSWGLYSPVPGRFGEWLVLLVAIIVSVQWGRGKWMPWRWLPTLRSVGSAFLFVLAFLLAPTVLPQLGGGGYDQGYQNAIEDNGGWNANPEGVGNGSPGMWVNGQLASNLFAFDADGNPLSDVQLFDQDGRPVVTVMDPTKNTTADNVPSYVGDQLLLAPRPTNGGQYAWNVFPLRTLPADAVDSSNGPDGFVDFSKAKLTAPPRITVYPLAPLDGQAQAEAKSTDTSGSSKNPTP